MSKLVHTSAEHAFLHFQAKRNSAVSYYRCITVGKHKPTAQASMIIFHPLHKQTAVPPWLCFHISSTTDSNYADCTGSSPFPCKRGPQQHFTCLRWNQGRQETGKGHGFVQGTVRTKGQSMGTFEYFSMLTSCIAIVLLVTRARAVSDLPCMALLFNNAFYIQVSTISQIYYNVCVEFDGNTAGRFGSAIETRNAIAKNGTLWVWVAIVCVCVSVCGGGVSIAALYTIWQLNLTIGNLIQDYSACLPYLVTALCIAGTSCVLPQPVTDI